MTGPELMTGRQAPPRRSATTRSPRWPRRPATTTRSAGGTTSSSPGWTASRRSPAITEAMAELRAGAPPRPRPPSGDEERREAHMRAGAAGRAEAGRHDRVAVVCGAWHAPALAAHAADRAADAALLRGLPKAQDRADLGAVDPRPAGRRVRATAPAITSPGWYHHLFTAPDRPGRPVATGSPACCAPATCRSRPRTSSRPSGWPRRWPRCAAGRCRADRGHRRDPGGAVRGRRGRRWSWSPASWSSARSSARCRRQRRRCRWRPTCARRPGRLRLSSTAPAATSTSTCASDDRPGGPAAAPAAAARRRLGRRRADGARRAARSGRPGGCAGSPSWPSRSSSAARWGTTVPRPPRPRVADRAADAGELPSSPPRSSASCWPTCRTRCPRC